MINSLYLSNQRDDFTLKREVTHHFQITYGHSRSRASRETDQSSEDYVAYDHSDTVLAFVLCDGVTQSIGADYAARYLAHRLLDYMWALRYKEDRSKKRLINYLNSITNSAQAYIANSPNPFDPGSNGYRFYELERQEGAEVKFIAGLVDCLADAVTLYMLGDLLFACMDKDGQLLPGEETSMGQWVHQAAQADGTVPPWQPQGAWSSVRGTVSQNSLRTWQSKTSDLRTMTLVTDGFIDPFQKAISQAFEWNPTSKFRQTCELGNDDIAYLEIDFHATAMQQLSAIQSCHMENHVVSWVPLAEADRYRLLFDNHIGEAIYREIEDEKCPLPFTEENLKAVRIQAVSSHLISGPWSPFFSSALDRPAPGAGSNGSHVPSQSSSDPPGTQITTVERNTAPAKGKPGRLFPLLTVMVLIILIILLTIFLYGNEIITFFTA